MLKLTSLTSTSSVTEGSIAPLAGSSIPIIPPLSRAAISWVIINTANMLTISLLISLPLFKLAMDVTIDTYTNGTTIQNIRFKNTSAIGVRALAPGPQITPMIPPATMPIMSRMESQ